MAGDQHVKIIASMRDFKEALDRLTLIYAELAAIIDGDDLDDFPASGDFPQMPTGDWPENTEGLALRKCPSTEMHDPHEWVCDYPGPDYEMRCWCEAVPF